jgi:aminopeptidase-like protein
VESFNAGDKDFSSQLLKIKEQNPDAYAAITSMVQAMISMARELMNIQGGQQAQGQPMAKDENQLSFPGMGPPPPPPRESHPNFPGLAKIKLYHGGADQYLMETQLLKQPERTRTVPGSKLTISGAVQKFLKLEDGEYEVLIDSTLENGNLTYGELYLQGEEEDEILISCHACHPSLANDNLSGVSLSTILAKYLGTVSHRFSYRFLFIPGTIGAITWLCLNENSVKRIKHGLVITGVGDSGKITYKKSRRGDAEIDRAAFHVLKHSGQPYDIIDFSPYGYDERQYCSPGFNLPVGRLSRTPFAEYPEYHTSADNLKFVHPEFLGDSCSKLLAIINILENNRRYLNLNPKCEPQLGKRDLYSSIGANELAMLWLLNLSDGYHTLLDISERSGLRFDLLNGIAKILEEEKLLRENNA